MTAFVNRYTGEKVLGDHMYATPVATYEFWGHVFDILEQEVGANPDGIGNGRSTFVGIMSKGDCDEFRFMGDLGFGGKVHVDGARRAYPGMPRPPVWVGAYPEDIKREPARSDRIAAANERLRALTLDTPVPPATMKPWQTPT